MAHDSDKWANNLADNRGVVNFPDCKGCVFAEPGKNGFQKAFCGVYNDGKFKPWSLCNGGQCEYYDEAEE
jgi:hypothetical protein